MSRTAITLKLKMCLFLDKASYVYWAKELLTDMNLPFLLPDEDNNFGVSLVLDFKKYWRSVQPEAAQARLRAVFCCKDAIYKGLYGNFTSLILLLILRLNFLLILLADLLLILRLFPGLFYASYWNLPPRRATGSPLGPVLANIFMCDFESGWWTPKLVLHFGMGTLMTRSPCFTAKTVQMSFFAFLHYLNSCHINIKFKIEF